MKIKNLFVIGLLLLLMGCVSTPPIETENPPTTLVSLYENQELGFQIS